MEKITILTMLNYEPTLFDNMALPTQLDREDMINTIIADCSCFELMYHRTDILKSLIAVWSRTNLKNWERLAFAYELEYNPIWNKDGKVIETLKEQNEGTNRNKTDSKINSNGTDETKENVVGYNSASEVEKSRTDGRNSNKTDSTTTSNGEDYNLHTMSNERVEQGNIGVTTTQSMLTEEIALRSNPLLNLYTFIARSFADRFCVKIY